MIPTKKQIGKIKGTWWGTRHEGPVLPKVNSNSLRSVIAYGNAKAAAIKAENDPTPYQPSELTQEILAGVPQGVIRA